MRTFLPEIQIKKYTVFSCKTMTLMWRKVNEESGMITTGISKGMGGLSTIWYTEKTTIRTP